MTVWELTACQASGDTEALAGFGVAAKAVWAVDWHTSAGIAGAAESADRVIAGADSIDAN